MNKQDTAPVVNEEPRTAVQARAEEEWESDGTEDVLPIFPVIKLIQPTSTMKDASKHGGEFFRTS